MNSKCLIYLMVAVGLVGGLFAAWAKQMDKMDTAETSPAEIVPSDDSPKPMTSEPQTVGPLAAAQKAGHAAPATATNLPSFQGPAGSEGKEMVDAKNIGGGKEIVDSKRILKPIAEMVGNHPDALYTRPGGPAAEYRNQKGARATSANKTGAPGAQATSTSITGEPRPQATSASITGAPGAQATSASETGAPKERLSSPPNVFNVQGPVVSAETR